MAKIHLVGSVHKRRTPIEKPELPTPAQFRKIVDSASIEELKKYGFGRWGNVTVAGKSRMLMLFPGEWHRFIPIGEPVYSLGGSKRLFSKTDSTDIRYGCLSYGILR